MAIALVIALTAIFAVSVIAALLGFWIWIRRRRHTRERFAFAALTAMTSLAFALLASMSTSLTPLHLIAALLERIFGYDLPLPDPRFADYVLMLLVYFGVLWVVVRLHRQWDQLEGLKSIEQYHREQRSEPSGVLVEGLHEMKRIIRREDPSDVFIARQFDLGPDPLERVTDSLAWKDQARELVRLSSSSYGFDEEHGFHDKQGYWEFVNLDTGDPVFLFPCHDAVTQADLDDFVEYANKIAASKAKSEPELIVAAKGDPEHWYPEQPSMSIRFVTESSLLDNLVNFTDYRNEIRKRVLVEHLPDSDFCLADVYVPSQYTAKDGQETGDSVEAYLADWLMEPGHRQLALLGEYGQGKSTTALLLTYRLLCNGSTSPARIPILIELRGKSPRNLSPLELLGAWAGRYGIDPRALIRLHIAGRLLLIFEGFDEMALIGDAEMRLKHFKTLWQFCYDNAKLLITGRPNFFLDDLEMKKALGIREPVADNPYCEAIRLVPFDVPRIGKALRAHDSNVRDQICSLAESNSNFGELISRPSLLHQVSVLWKKEHLSERVEELTSAYVLGLFVRHSYRRQGLKEFDSPGFMALTVAEREFFMDSVATYMAAKGLPNQISGSQLNELTEDLVHYIPDSISEMSSVMSGETTKPLRIRIEESEFGMDHVKADVRACGLLVDDPATPGTFRFGHKSFMEFLFAAVVSERIREPDSARARSILAATNTSLERVLYLPVSIGFLAELLGAGRVGSANAHSESDTSRKYDERSVATRLLKTILGDDLILAVLGRLFGFCSVLLVSLRGVRRFGPPIDLLFAMMPIPLISVVMIYAIHRQTAGDMGATFFNFLGIPPMGFTLAAGMAASLYMILYKSLKFPHTTKVGRRWVLWNRICSEICIRDSLMHSVAGTWIVPWVRKKQFDFFLRPPDKSTARTRAKR